MRTQEGVKKRSKRKNLARPGHGSTMGFQRNQKEVGPTTGVRKPRRRRTGVRLLVSPTLSEQVHGRGRGKKFVWVTSVEDHGALKRQTRRPTRQDGLARRNEVRNPPINPPGESRDGMGREEIMVIGKGKSSCRGHASIRERKEECKRLKRGEKPNE